MRLGQAGPCGGTFSVHLDRAPEVLDAPRDVERSSLFPEMLRLEQRLAHVRSDDARASRNASNGREKPVSGLGQRLDEPRPRDTVAEKLPQPVDRLVDPTIEVDVSVFRPYRVAKFFSGDHAAARRDQQQQHVERLPLKAQASSTFTQLVRATVELEVAERVDRRRAGRAHRAGS